MFSFDWFHGGGLKRLVEIAKDRCTRQHFEDQQPAEDARRGFFDALETRTIIYMKDGLTYEMRELLDLGTSTALGFECVPVDENYRVGSIVIVCPFDDIARVEVFAVHPDDKPQENFRITGFRAGQQPDRDAM